MKKIFLIIIACLSLDGCWWYNRADHSGLVTGVAVKGIIIKTYRVFFQTGENSTSYTKYCVDSEDIFNKLKDASIHNQKVTISYHRELFRAFWRCSDEEEIIDGIEENKWDYINVVNF